MTTANIQTDSKDNADGYCLTADQVQRVQGLTKRHNLDERSIAQLVSLAEHYLQNQRLVATRSDVRNLLNGDDWKNLFKLVNDLLAAILSLMYTGTDLDDSELEILEKDLPDRYKATKAAYDETERVIEFADFNTFAESQKRFRKINPPFFALLRCHFAANNFSSDALGQKESREAMTACVKLEELRIALEEAKIALQLPDKRGRGRQVKDQNRQLFEGFKQLCELNNITATDAPNSDFVRFLGAYLKILDISTSATSMAKYYLSNQSVENK